MSLLPIGTPASQLKLAFNTETKCIHQIRYNPADGTFDDLGEIIQTVVIEGA